jgi:putative nucleotidyltransferase with HDIG domain
VSAPSPHEFYLDLFARLGESVTSAFHLDEDLARILDHALVAAGAGRGRLMLLDAHRDRMIVRAAANEGGDGGVGDAVPEGPPPPGVVRIPLIGRGEPLGLLEIDLRGAPALTEERRRLVGAVAAQAALFVEHARLSRETRRMFLDIIVALAGAVDAKDAYTHSHTVRVATIALRLARPLGLDAADRESLLLAALLHDVGKIGNPDAILKKPGRLDPAEAAVMREHPALGAGMLRHIRSLKDALPGIRHHHEHWDGSGYPDGLAGTAIPLSARIILVADAFDALTTDRVYRPGVATAPALDRMRPMAGAQFDPDAFACLEELCRTGGMDTDADDPGDLFALLRSGI